jgi:hypothetical protein
LTWVTGGHIHTYENVSNRKDIVILADVVTQKAKVAVTKNIHYGDYLRIKHGAYVNLN